MIAPLQALATIALEAILIYGNARASGPYRLRGLAIINLIIVALCSPKLFDVFGLVTNVTSIMYAAVFLIQGLVLMNFGRQAAYWTIEMAIFTLMSFFSIWFLAASFPSSLDMVSIEYSNAMAVISASMTRNILALLTSFIISTVALVETYAWARGLRWGKLSAFALSLAVAQAMDSLLFFAVAFHDMATIKQLEVMFTGFLLKLTIGFCYLPVVSCINYRIEMSQKAKPGGYPLWPVC